MVKNQNSLVSKIIFILALLVCLTPFIDPPLALLMGLLVAQTTGLPFVHLNSKAINYSLKTSVIGLGFGMNLSHTFETGKTNFILIISSIITILFIGYFLGKIFKVDGKTSFLIASGSAICGGSAIATLSPVLNANAKQMSSALGIVFILNALSLVVFPFAGRWLNLTQYQFGLWSAIAIHDTSSVVGAASKFGEEALQIATTIKLERVLWIIPLSVVARVAYRENSEKIRFPYFILLFVVAMCLATYLPALSHLFSMLVVGAKKMLTLTLFFIGAGLSVEVIKGVGLRPFFQGALLWIIVSLLSLSIIIITT